MLKLKGTLLLNQDIMEAEPRNLLLDKLFIGLILKLNSSYLYPCPPSSGSVQTDSHGAHANI